MNNSFPTLTKKDIEKYRDFFEKRLKKELSDEELLEICISLYYFGRAQARFYLTKMGCKDLADKLL